MTDYNLGRVVGADGTGIQSIASVIEASGRTKVVITLTTGTTETFYIEKGTKGDTGTGIRTIELISTYGKDKNYRITFTDNTTFDYTIRDGEDAVCDTELDIDSENAVQNKVITGAINNINTAIDDKYDKNDVLQLLIDYGLVRTADTVDNVVLAGDKEVLSYADGDRLTLSATVYDEDNDVVPNKKVVFYKNEVVLDTIYTDANGVASYEYVSEGAGDLRFEASVGSLLSETYIVEDCINYDNALLDKTSKYISTNITSLTHSDNAYTVVSGASSSNSNYFGLVSFKDTTIPSNFKASVDMKFTHSGTEIHHTLMPTNNLTNSVDNIIGVQLGEFKEKYGIVTRPWKDSEVSRANGQLSSDTWYTFEISHTNGVWTGKIIVNNSVLWTGTVNASKTINYIGIAESGGHNTFQFKNLKIKPV